MSNTNQLFAKMMEIRMQAMHLRANGKCEMVKGCAFTEPKK